MRNRLFLTLLMLLLPITVLADGTVLLPATGQTRCYNAAGTVIDCAGTGQDGAVRAGAAWPSPRLVDNGNGTVTDHLTGLIWLRNANCAATLGGVTKTTTLTWANARTWSNALASGSCGLSDGSVAGDWRLPNRKELRSLTNRQQADSATWLNGQGFANVQAGYYWSASTYASSPAYAWYVSMNVGYVNDGYKSVNYYVWPVRGGQSSALSVILAGVGSGTIAPDSGSLAWSGATGTASYPEDTVVTLTATPEAGSTFAGWSGGGCSGTGTCQTTLGANTTVTATFAMASHTVTPDAPGIGNGGSLSPATPQSVPHNHSTSFTVTADSGYQIDSVTGCGGSLSGSTYTTGPITADCTVSATFILANLPTVGNIANLYAPASNTSGSYQISWNKSATAGVTYVLTENGSPIYTGTNSYFNVTGRGNGTYSYTVKATKTDHADSAVKGPVSTTVLLTVGNIANIYAPASNSTGSYQISWNKSSTAGVTYKLYEGATEIYNGPNSYFNVSGKGNGNYSYTVMATRAGYLDSATKGPVSTTVALAVGNIANIYAPASNTTGTFQVSWNKSSTAGVTYILTENGTPIYSGANSYFNIAGRGNGTYSYTVKATRAGYTDSAERGPVTTTVALAVGSIANIYAPASNTTGSYQVSWNKSSTAGVTYILTENGITIYTGANSYFNVTGRGNGPYSYTVQATKAGYTSSTVKGPVSTTVTLTCGNIANIYAPSSNTTGAFQISWNKSATAGVTYVLERSTDGGAWAVEPQFTVTTRNYVNITGLPSGSYQWRVKAVLDGYVDSAWRAGGTTVVTRP